MENFLKKFCLLFITVPFVTCLFFLPGPLSADTVILKNGSHVTGIVTEEDKGDVTLQFDKEATVTFSSMEVKRVIYASEEERAALRAEWEKKLELSQEVPPEIQPEATQETPPQMTFPIISRRIAKAPPLTPTKENQIFLSEGDWKVRKSPHFVVYYQDLAQGRAVSGRAEYHLEKILGDLRIRRLKDRRRKFTIFVVQEKSQWNRFLEQLGIEPELIGGFTTGAKTREMFLYSLSIPYLQLAFPHELTHILLEEKADGRKIPLWFNEGFANYEGGIIGIDEGFFVEAVQKGKYIPLSELVTRIIYPTEVDQKKLFYTESESLIEYLITQYGRRRFGEFTEHLFETGDFKQALRSVYGGKIGSLEQLNQLWLEYLSE